MHTHTQHTQAAVSLAMSALLFQPIANSGMYTMDASGALSKGSFNKYTHASHSYHYNE
jgi:hypothetical protein